MTGLGARRFTDRTEAGEALGEALRPAYGGRHDVTVLGLPRGGVAVAAPVARALGAPLDVLVVRKVGAPRQPELALGAVVPGHAPVLNPEVLRAEQPSEAELAALVAEQVAEARRREQRFRPGRPPLHLAGRVAVVVDDGLATGATVRAAVAALRGLGAAAPDRVVVAVPVGPRETLEVLEREADEVVCLSRPLLFRAVGWAYDDFRQVSDDEVVDLLAAST